MRPGYEDILSNAEQEIEFVSDFASELRTTRETRKLWRAWSGVLDHYAKAVSALRRATDGGSSKGWSDRILHEQKNDPILQYAFQARDHASHVFEGKREARSQSVELGRLLSISGNSTIFLENNYYIGPNGQFGKFPDGTLRTHNGRYAGGTIPKSAVQERDHHVVLRSVKTRSGVYEVPNPMTHPEKQAIEITEHVKEWLNQKLFEAKEFAAKEAPEKTI